jgi:hypothetical protein
MIKFIEDWKKRRAEKAAYREEALQTIARCRTARHDEQKAEALRQQEELFAFGAIGTHFNYVGKDFIVVRHNMITWRHIIDHYDSCEVPNHIDINDATISTIYLSNDDLKYMKFGYIDLQVLRSENPEKPSYIK